MAEFTDEFAGQVAVITGGSSGIGRAVALGLARAGAALCLVGRRAEALEAVAQSGVQSGARVQCYPTDLSVDEDLQRLIAALRDLGRVDLLIHSAGAISLGRFETAPVEALDMQYRVNVRAPFVLTQSLLPLLRERQGQVVFINSLVGAKANASQYAASKHALKALADSLRDEVNAQGIRVLTFYPGSTASPMQARVCAIEGRVYHPERLMQPEDVAVTVIGALSVPRSAEVTEIQMRPFIKAS